MTQTRVKYIIPEDGDDIEHPNVFTLQSSSSSNNITFSDIKKSFPLSESDKYHFRFLKALNPENKVWLDVINDADVLPTVNGSIFAKVSRIGNNSMNVSSNVSTTNTTKSPVNRQQSAVAPPVLHQPHPEANLLGEDIGFTSTPTSAPSKPVRTSIANSSTAPPINLLDTGDFHTITGNNDLLDMMSSSGHHPKSVDLFDTSSSSLPTKPLQQTTPIMQQQSQERGIGKLQQQQPQRMIGLSQQQERKESPPQPMRGKTHDAFSGLGDFKM